VTEATRALTGGLGGLVRPEYRARKALQVLELPDERVTSVFLDHLESLECLE